jgi:hypothetical protein
MQLTDADPKGLIRESYAIDGITLGECRSIFVDWALSLPVGSDMAAAITFLLAHYAQPGHPMTETLRAGLAPAEAPKRRGGRAGRVASD